MQRAVMNREVKRMRALAEDGMSAARIAIEVGRSHDTVDRYAGDILERSALERAEARTRRFMSSIRRPA